MYLPPDAPNPKAFKMRPMAFSTVDFPHPLGPMMEVIFL